MIGIIYGALAALAQTDIKRLVAYSSVSHMGFIVLGMFALNCDGSRRLVDSDAQPWPDDGGSLRLRGDDLRAVSHARHEEDRRAVEPAADPGLLPDSGGAGLGGGAGIERVRRRVSDSGRHVRDQPAGGVLAATGMVLGACYLLWMLREVLFGPLREPDAHGMPRRARMPKA